MKKFLIILCMIFMGSCFGMRLTKLDGNTRIIRAISKGDVQRAKKLLKKLRNPNVRDCTGFSALHWTSTYGSCEVICLLLENGAKIDIRGKFCRTTPLHKAIDAGSFEKVELLLEKGANIDAVDHEGSSSLHRAFENEDLAFAVLLIRKGADLAAKDEEGLTALHKIAREGDIEACDAFFKGIVMRDIDKRSQEARARIRCFLLVLNRAEELYDIFFPTEIICQILIATNDICWDFVCALGCLGLKPYESDFNVFKNNLIKNIKYFINTERLVGLIATYVGPSIKACCNEKTNLDLFDA